MKKRSYASSVLLSVLLLTGSVVSYTDSAAADNRTVTTVNGVTITETEVNHFMSKLTRQVPAERALQEMINVELLVQAAKDKGLMNDEELLLEIKRSTTGIIASYYLQRYLSALNITVEDLKARYNSEYVEGNQAKEYNANHILLKTEAEAKDVIQQLDNGSVFTELAKTLSTGPSGKNGGALGWFKTTDMVAPFSQAATTLAPGQYSKQAVKTQFGWHILFLNDTRTTEPPTFESVSKKLSAAIAAEEIGNIMKQLHDSATIKFPGK